MLTVLQFSVLSAAIPGDPVLQYVFDTADESVKDIAGQYPDAILADGAQIISVQDTGVLFLDGKKGYADVPESVGLHAGEKGISFCAVVKFADSGKVAGQNDAQDMILFKKDEFVFSRESGKIRFSLVDRVESRKWAATIFSPAVPADVWVHVAAVAEKTVNSATSEKNYLFTLYINGEAAAREKYFIEPAVTDNPVNVGMGWGGPHFLHGYIAEVSVFDRPLSSDDVRALSAVPKYKKIINKDISSKENLPESGKKKDSVEVKSSTVKTRAANDGILGKYIFNKLNEDVISGSGLLPAVLLKGGAAVIESEKGNVLELDGIKNYCEIPDSQGLNVSEKGFSVCAVVKFADNGSTAGQNDSHDMIIFKKNQFLLGRDMGKLYFNMHDGAKWAAAVQGGTIPADVWIHAAAVVERINDPAQGEVGYKIILYHNGELVLSKKFLNITPAPNDELVNIGMGWGGPWFLNGQVAELSIFDRALLPGEIDAMATASSQVKITRKGFTGIDSTLKEKIVQLEKAAMTKTGKWAASCLTRAGMLGFDNTKISAAIGKVIPAVLGAKEETDFIQKWNSKKTEFEIVVNNELCVMLIISVPAAFPLAGIMNRGTGLELMGEMPVGWSIAYSANGIAGKLVTIENTDAGVTGKINAVTYQDGIAAFTMEWMHKMDEHHPFAFTIKSDVRVDGPRVEMGFNIENQSMEISVREVEFPKFKLSKLSDGKDKLVYPWMSGVLVNNPTQEQFMFGQDGLYPASKVNMQFGAYYDSGTGIYFAFEDPAGRSKYFSVKGIRNELEVIWKSYAGLTLEKNKGGNDFSINGKGVIQLFKGDWFDAGQVYKKFLAGQAAWWIKDLPRKDTPEWFRNLPLWILFTYGQDYGKKAFSGQMDTILDFKKYLDLPFGIHWYGWEDTAKGEWPHFYPKDGVMELIKEFTSNKIYTKPYIDNRLWAKLDLKGTDWKFTSTGKPMTVKNIDGSLSLESYDKLEWAVMCPAAKGWQLWMKDLCTRLMGYGFSAIYHDQVAAGKPIFCFDPSHGHSLGGGEVWLEKGYWPMLNSIRQENQKQFPLAAMDTEENAEPYLKCFDGFLPWRWTDTGQIPLFVSIYAGRVQFTGRVFDHQVSGSPESFFIKAAEQLVNAEQIGWFTLNDLSMPGKKKLFIKKLSHLRYAIAEILNESSMLHPLTFKNEPETITTKWGGVSITRSVTTQKLRHSVWKNSDTVMMVFVNSVDEEIIFEPVIKINSLGLVPGNLKMRRYSEGSAKPEEKIISVDFSRKSELAPLSSEVWFFSSAENKNAVHEKRLENLTRVMDKMKEFTEGTYPDFPQVFSGTASDTKWFTALNAVGLMGASVQSNKEFVGWIQKDGLVYYGLVDFGAQKESRYIEIDAAVDAQFAGGGIRFMTDFPGKDGKLLAKFDALKATGGWRVFAPVSAGMASISGKHKVFAVFESSACCNLKRWRVVKK